MPTLKVSFKQKEGTPFKRTPPPCFLFLDAAIVRRHGHQRLAPKKAASKSTRSAYRLGDGFLQLGFDLVPVDHVVQER